MTTVTDTMQSTASVVHQAKFIDVKGIRTRYYELGSGEPMLLIHGATFSGQGSANTWTLNLAGLSQNFHVFAPDRLGNGMTDNPSETRTIRQKLWCNTCTTSPKPWASRACMWWASPSAPT